MHELLEWMKLSRKVFVLWLVMVAFLTWFGVELIQERTTALKDEKYLETSNLMRNKLQTLISEKKESLILVSTALAQDERLKNALLSGTPDVLELDEIALALEQQSSLKNIWLHVVTHEGKSFYRSWTPKRGDDLTLIRPDMVAFLKDPKPSVSISTGLFDLTFKATVPIFHKGKLIGAFETISKVNSITQKMRHNDFDMVVLVDKKFRAQITDPFTGRFLQDYYVANLNAKERHLELIHAYNIENLLENAQSYVLFEDAGFLAHAYHVPDVTDKPMSYFVMLYDLDMIDMSDIYLMRDQLISIFMTVFVVILALFYYVNLNRRKQMMQTINTELEQKVKEKTKTLNHLAHHDILTGLPNRLLFMDRLDQAIKHAKRHSSTVFVLFLDLDRFKEVNDSMGHKAGDMLLQQITSVLKKNLREVDTIARLGGDEFTIILEELTQTQVEAVCEKLLESISTPFHIEGHEIYVTFSIGVSTYPANANNPDDLLRNADTAMYKAKRTGKNRYFFYDESLTVVTVNRAKLEHDLHRAIEYEEFEPYFQPKIDHLKKKIIGVEALVRWNHPRKGVLAPGTFVGLAQELGLMLVIDRWMLTHALTQVKKWQKSGIHVGKLALNVTVKQLEKPDFVEFVSDLLTRLDFDASYLELELTENEIMQDPQTVIIVLNELKKLGVGLSIDDFGTGYSSLAYLKRLPIDTLKIDKSFVDDLITDEEDKAIVGSIIAMAKSLHLDVIAEGVETHDQKALLCEMGCCWLQGYLYAKPLTSEAFEHFYHHFKG